MQSSNIFIFPLFVSELRLTTTIPHSPCHFLTIHCTALYLCKSQHVFVHVAKCISLTLGNIFVRLESGGSLGREEEEEEEGTGDLGTVWLTTVPSVVESGEAFSLKEVLLEYGQEAGGAEDWGGGWC